MELYNNKEKLNKNLISVIECEGAFFHSISLHILITITIIWINFF